MEVRCSFGFFCPNTTVQIPCPGGYFCDSGSVAPFLFLDEGCAPPMVYLPFTSNRTENLGYRNENISVSGNCVLQSRMCYLAKPCMGGLRCDGGKSSYVRIPIYLNESFSVAMWMYPDSGGQLISSQYSDVIFSVLNIFYSSNSLSTYYAINPYLSGYAVLYSDSAWTHVAVSFRFSSGVCTGTMYFNGLEVARTVVSSSSIILGKQVVFIGYSDSSLSGFFGGVSQFGLFNYAISAQQAYSIFKGTPTSCRCPVGFYCISTTSPPTECPSGI